MDLLSALVARSKVVADPRAAAYASGNRPYLVRITRPAAQPTFNRNTNTYTDPADTVVYEGRARLYTISGGSEADIGDERVQFSSAQMSIDSRPGVLPRVDDLVVVLSNAQSISNQVVGREFTVNDVEIAGHFDVGILLTLTGAAPSRRNA